MARATESRSAEASAATAAASAAAAASSKPGGGKEVAAVAAAADNQDDPEVPVFLCQVTVANKEIKVTPDLEVRRLLDICIQAFLDISKKNLRPKKLKPKKNSSKFSKKTQANDSKTEYFANSNQFFLLQKAHNLIDLALKFIQTEFFYLTKLKFRVF